MDFEEQRQRMVDQQLVPRGISDPKVLDAFRKVPRHHYVPAPMTLASYADHPLPIGEGQTISQPYIVAEMTQALGLKGGERVLEIGTGSGYQAAILAEICSEVYTVEQVAGLIERAEKTLSKEGYRNIFFKCGDGTEGWEEKAPFDSIIVTAAAPDVPEPLKMQLAEEGRIVIPVGALYSQMLVSLEKREGKFIQHNICGCIFVPLIGKHGWQGDVLL
ncbi:MAG: protein-L-isoaspartate(D-aspartate) O-methyltransferase [Candidatus Omnitrophota bacterium]